jgi:multidrug efflux pump subunit AcrA (membrane-fusion protein)
MHDNLTCTGSVTRVDQMAKPIRRDSKVKVVEAVVEIDSTHAGLLPGMTVTCQIVVDQFENVIAVPQECVFKQDSTTVIYDWRKSRFKAVPVSVLYQSLDFAVLSGDIGDEVQCAMREPGH